MGYLAQMMANGSQTRYSGSKYLSLSAGSKKLYVQTGTASSQRLAYPLTTNTSASKYCNFSVMVNGQKAYLASGTSTTIETTNNNTGTLVSQSHITQSLYNTTSTTSAGTSQSRTYTTDYKLTSQHMGRYSNSWWNSSAYDMYFSKGYSLSTYSFNPLVYTDARTHTSTKSLTNTTIQTASSIYVASSQQWMTSHNTSEKILTHSLSSSTTFKSEGYTESYQKVEYSKGTSVIDSATKYSYYIENVKTTLTDTGWESVLVGSDTYSTTMGTASATQVFHQKDLVRTAYHYSHTFHRTGTTVGNYWSWIYRRFRSLMYETDNGYRIFFHNTPPAPGWSPALVPAIDAQEQYFLPGFGFYSYQNTTSSQDPSYVGSSTRRFSHTISITGHTHKFSQIWQERSSSLSQVNTSSSRKLSTVVNQRCYYTGTFNYSSNSSKNSYCTITASYSPGANPTFYRTTSSYTRKDTQSTYTTTVDVEKKRVSDVTTYTNYYTRSQTLYSSVFTLRRTSSYFTAHYASKYTNYTYTNQMSTPCDYYKYTNKIIEHNANI